MSNVITVGCDLHDRSMLLKTACGKNKAEQKSFLNDAENRLKMVNYLRQFAEKQQSKRIVFVYEASGLGYGLYDLLLDHDIECYVLSPTHLPKTPKSKRNKTDAKDAQMLFEQARGIVLRGMNFRSSGRLRSVCEPIANWCGLVWKRAKLRHKSS